MPPQKQVISWSLPTKLTSWAPTSPLAISRSLSFAAAPPVWGCLGIGGDFQVRVGVGAPLVTLVTVVFSGGLIRMALGMGPAFGALRLDVFLAGAVTSGRSTSVLSPLFD